MDITDFIGSFGRLQQGIFLVLFIRPISWCVMNMNYNFVVQPIAFYCEANHATLSFTNGSYLHGNDTTNQCFISSSSNDTLQKCSSWIYEAGSKNSFVDQWDLVCDNIWLIRLGYVVFPLGNLLFYMPAGQLADKFGRRRICLIGQSLILLTTVLLPLSNSIWMFLGFRFLLACFQGLAHNAFLCLFLETVGPHYRDLLMCSFSLSWGIGIMITAGVSWLLEGWRSLFWTCSAPFQLPLLLGIWWYVPESTKWLLSTKRFERAEKSLVSQAKINGITILDSKSVLFELSSKINEDKDSSNQSFLDVIRNKMLRRSAIIIYLSFLFTVFINHGFTITIGSLGGNMYINMFLNGLTEVAVVILYFPTVRFLDRRNGLLATFIFCGIAFILAVFFRGHYALKVTLAMAGKLSNNLAYAMLYIYTAELFPTNVRVVATSGAMTAGRIGSILAPFADISRGYYGEAIPLLFGFVSFITGGILYKLPETKHITLPDIITQIPK